jgi:hypothetical protein
VGSNQAGNIDRRVSVLSWFLKSSAHGEELVNGIQFVLSISVENSLTSLLAQLSHKGSETFPYTKHLDVVQDLIIEGEVIARNDINAGLLLDLPVVKAESFAFAEKLVTRKLASPVRFGGFLEVTVHSHARETEDGSSDEYQSRLHGAFRKLDSRLDHSGVLRKAPRPRLCGGKRVLAEDGTKQSGSADCQDGEQD